MELYLVLGIAILLIIGLLQFKSINTQGFSNLITDNYKIIDASGTDLGKDVIMEPVYEKPFATTPIQSVDDYEYNLVFQNEGDRGITKAQRDYLMSQYPMDWSTQPPSSSKFESGLAKFKEAFENKPQLPKENPYKQVDGSSMVPPDTLSIEQKEREILATYVPKKPQELTTYDAEDAKALISKIYDAKGLVPDFMEKKPGVFVVTGTRRKDEKIVYEDDEAPNSSGPLASAGERSMADTPVLESVGEGNIVVPPVGYETSAGLDPFFTAGAKTRDGKWDYQSWTPGLERMFAPSEPRTNWF
jgi:hypothetical protein